MLQPEWSPNFDVVLDVGKNVGAVSQDKVRVFEVLHQFEESQHVLFPPGIVGDSSPPLVAYDQMRSLLHFTFEIRPEVDRIGRDGAQHELTRPLDMVSSAQDIPGDA